MAATGASELYPCIAICLRYGAIAYHSPAQASVAAHLATTEAVYQELGEAEPQLTIKPNAPSHVPSLYFEKLRLLTAQIVRRGARPSSSPSKFFPQLTNPGFNV